MKNLYRYTLSYYVEEPEPHEENGKFAVGCKLQEIKVIKEYPKNYRILTLNNKEKIIRKGAKNTYAYETKEAALKNFYFRTRSYALIMKNKSKIILYLLKNIEEQDKAIIYGK
jgi:hypothetical protein